MNLRAQGTLTISVYCSILFMAHIEKLHADMYTGSLSEYIYRGAYLRVALEFYCESYMLF